MPELPSGTLPVQCEFHERRYAKPVPLVSMSNKQYIAVLFASGHKIFDAQLQGLKNMRQMKTSLCHSVSFLRQRSLGLSTTIGPADPQGVHAILEHATADSQHGGRMSLYVCRSLERIQNDFAFELHDGFLQ